jgi:hypothetical protein
VDARAERSTRGEAASTSISSRSASTAGCRNHESQRTAVVLYHCKVKTLFLKEDLVRF